MTFNSAIAVILRHGMEIYNILRPIASYWLKLDLYCLQQMQTINLGFGDVGIMVITEK